MNAPVNPKLTLLQAGIASALSGDKQAAREVLEQVTTLHPDNELAWLWLASVALTPQETIRCWRRVVKLNPQQEQAVQGLQRLLLQEGINAAKNNRREEARELLLELTQLDAQSEIAWLWLATLAKDVEEAYRCTSQVLVINPQNERALAWLEKLRSHAPSLAATTQPRQAATESIISAPLNVSSSSGWSCPLCAYEALRAVARCPRCHAVVSLASLDEILGNKEVNVALVREAVRRLEDHVEAQGEQADYATVFNLGLGYLNLNQWDEGAKYVRRASELKLKDTRLKAQVESLLERMSESAVAAQEAVKTALHADVPPLHKVATGAPGPSGTYTILVVDDSPTIRKLVTMTLEKYGHRVLSATNGLDALNKLKEVVPDLILSDINMPHMDGYQLCKMIRGNPITRGVPVIMLSGKDGIFDKLRGRMVGATAYLTKPFEIDSLLQLIDMHCQQTQGV
ncbi:MAG TPA: response regulator [Blastocatellia bacterium]|nr:response regulator [Blastocatellia bacterium]